MNKQTIERIAIIGLVGLLVGYGIYQTAYGYYATNETITIPQNGTFNAPNMPYGLWAKIRAPP